MVSSVRCQVEQSVNGYTVYFYDRLSGNSIFSSVNSEIICIFPNKYVYLNVWHRLVMVNSKCTWSMGILLCRETLTARTRQADPRLSTAYNNVGR
ncbi:unnamed protein product [Leptidea sinapis]|uniref:Uncharacterized protein n=1 Tax=Leptidea sinapis TaxID=189913 RepID=A0A5E4QCL7_9NEOP|nr:unnamed protein product [Leptidea sinapis]